MSDRPIIFSGPMVQAILDGRKTQTRRVAKLKRGISLADVPQWIDEGNGVRRAVFQRDQIAEPPYATGDRLWVRETCSAVESHDGLDCVRYEADQVWRPIANTPEAAEQWCALFAYRNGRGLSVPSIHMPRWASRLTLIVENVRVQRLQEISAADTLAEGFECETCAAMQRSACCEKGCFASIGAFRDLWDNLNAKRGYDWETNPWVVALTFRAIQKNIDEVKIDE